LTQAPKTYSGKKIGSSANVCWENCMATCRRLKSDPHFLSCTKINSKWIKDLNVRPETLKLLEENIRKTLEDIGIGNIFLTRLQFLRR
jgi:uncharacterized protein with NRDE domain